MRRRRGPSSVQLSFPEVNRQEAMSTALAGTVLHECERRRCFACSRRRHECVFRVDEEWWYLERLPQGPLKAKKWLLVDICAVNPLVVHEWLSEANDKEAGAARAREFELLFFGRQRLKLRAATREEAKLWVTALQGHLAKVSRASTLAGGLFRKADANSDGSLGFAELKKLLTQLNAQPSQQNLIALFEEFDKDGSGSISEEEFKELFCKMTVKPALSELFLQYCAPCGGDGEERVMPVEDFVRFLREVQREHGATEESVLAETFRFLRPPLVTAARDALTETGFTCVMCGRGNFAIDPQRGRLHQDMDQPLSRYWISCSHNTYLEGNQVGGTASVDQYLEVLSQGCRCVEIDLWDGPQGEPVVTHGYTLSGKIDFAEVAQALADHAFEHSHFPLILSLENHCGPGQIGRIGQILLQTFGDMLLRHPAPGGHEGQSLVTPQQAKDRVIVKAKLAAVRKPRLIQRSRLPPARCVTAERAPFAPRSRGCGPTGPGQRKHNTMRTKTVPLLVEESRRTISGKRSTRSFRLGMRASRRYSSRTPGPSREVSAETFRSGSSGSSTTLGSPVTSLSGALPGKRSAHKSQRGSNRDPVATLSPGSAEDVLTGINQFNSLIYLVGRKMHGLDSEHPPCCIASFSEAKMQKLCRRHGRALNAHHCDHLSRVFPPGSNVRSANFDPMTHWSHGAQLVALNFQTSDTGMVLNEGMFREQNGGFGYVLKPPSVLTPAAQCTEAQEVTLCITVLSAHVLPSIAEPTVVVRVHGPSGEPAENKTRSVKDNSFSPQWDERFVFRVERDEVSILTLEICDGQDDKQFVVAAAYVVASLRQGVRWVPLWDSTKREVPNCGMLVRMEIERGTGEPALVSTAEPRVQTPAPQAVKMEGPLDLGKVVEVLDSAASDTESTLSESDSSGSEPLARFGDLRVHRSYVAV